MTGFLRNEVSRNRAGTPPSVQDLDSRGARE